VRPLIRPLIQQLRSLVTSMGKRIRPEQRQVQRLIRCGSPDSRTPSAGFSTRRPAHPRSTSYPFPLSPCRARSPLYASGDAEAADKGNRRRQRDARTRACEICGRGDTRLDLSDPTNKVLLAAGPVFRAPSPRSFVLAASGDVDVVRGVGLTRQSASGGRRRACAAAPAAKAPPRRARSDLVAEPALGSPGRLAA